MYERPITHRYADPVDLIWIQAASELGLEVVRSKDVFASYDGKGKLTISTSEHFDADDCLAQMIFHEICHWLVAGRRGYKLEDWGLSNLDDRDLTYEYAAIRVQTALAQTYGLRDFMAVTTDWRPYWSELPEDPLQDGEDPAIPLAQEAYHLARLEPFAKVLKQALGSTASIADAVRSVADTSSLWKLTQPRHRLGSLLNQNCDLQCGTCAWAFEDGAQPGCRQHRDEENNASSVSRTERACDRWEAKFSIEDCGSGGACCHRGFDVLSVANDDPFSIAKPHLVQLRSDGEYCVPRPDGNCVALDGDGTTAKPYRCQHYSIRPQNCRDFEVAGDACLVARRRVGLSK